MIADLKIRMIINTLAAKHRSTRDIVHLPGLPEGIGSHMADAPAFLAATGRQALCASDQLRLLGPLKHGSASSEALFPLYALDETTRPAEQRPQG